MPVIKCLSGRVYCGPQFEKLRLMKDESMTIEPGQISFFQKLLDNGRMILLDKKDSVPVIDSNSTKDEIPKDEKTEEDSAPQVSAPPVQEGIALPSINPQSSLKKNNHSKGKRKHRKAK